MDISANGIHINEAIIFSALIVVLAVLFYIERKVNMLLRKREEEKNFLRIRRLERELEQYMVNSRKRLDIFKRVIDGFDHVIQNVKGVIQEAEYEDLNHITQFDDPELLEELSKEAEVIRINKEFEKESEKDKDGR